MEAARAVAVQVGLEITVVAFCFFEVEGDAYHVQVRIRIGAELGAIILGATDAGAGEVFEIHTDDGIYSRREPGRAFEFWSWERIEEEERYGEPLDVEVVACVDYFLELETCATTQLRLMDSPQEETLQ
ncbi:hypothetical protein [Nannocystis pusilla]|uniref:hypothetical protein n=1 Tax=Nannocystis pusilla TaxID=889268 RepID=UPI003B7A2A7E